MYKKLNNWEMQTGGNQVYVDDEYAYVINGLDAFNRTNTKIHAMTIGLKVTKSFNKNVVGTLIFDFYPVVRYIGNQNWSDVNHWGLRNNGYSNNYGFNIRPEVDFQINKNLFAKLYAYYEMIAINKLNELPSEPFDKVIKGKMMYHSFGLGLAIGFSGV